MLRIKKYIFVFILLFLMLPMLVIGQSDPNNTGLAVECLDDYCVFDDFIRQINVVVDFLLFKLAMPIAAIVFAAAGGMLIFSGGSEEKWNKAKSLMTSTLIGFLWMLGAWLVVHTIFYLLGYSDSTGIWN